MMYVTNSARVHKVADEPAVAPDRGGMTVFQGSTSHEPPRQVNGGVRPLQSDEACHAKG